MIKRGKIAARLNGKTKAFQKDPFFIIPRPVSLQKERAAAEINNGSASVDLRLGTWFLAMRPTAISLLEPGEPSGASRRLKRCTEELNLDVTIFNAIKNHINDKRPEMSPQSRAIRRALEDLKLNVTIYNELKDTFLASDSDNRLANLYHIRFGEDFILHPRSFVLGVTLEWMRFPSDLGGYVIGRSSWGRRGLIIATATGVHPGFTGCLTLELANLGDIPIAIRPGMTIGQIFIHPVDSRPGDKSVDQSSFACKRAPRLGHPEPDEIAIKLATASF
jgi:deoxycytidine triphosphate deaminase